MNFISKTFDETFEEYKDYFIKRNGYMKYNKVCDNIIGSSKLRSLIDMSKFRQVVPSETDFSIAVTSTFYFSFRGFEVTAMAVLISIKHWNDEVNSLLYLCPDDRVNAIASKSLHRWCGMLLYKLDIS